MNRDPSHERRDARLDNEPLWLTVTRDGKSESYEFPPGGDDTTVVVGSSDRVQVRIAGAAPIAFYVERVENELCITSCYLGSDLCIDGRVVSGRRTIVGRATVELAGVRLVLAVRDNPPTLPGYYVEATPEAARASASATPATSLPVAVDPSLARSHSREPRPSVSRTALAASARSVSSTAGSPPTACFARRGTPETAKASEKARDAYLSALDAWFDATFLSDQGTKNALPKLDEPSAVRVKPVPLKQVSVPPRPRPTVRRPYSDFAQTQELAPIRLMAITEELKTIELGQRIRESDPQLSTNADLTREQDAADLEMQGNTNSPTSSGSEAPTERAFRVGFATSTPKSDSAPVVMPKSAQSNVTTLLPSVPPRKRRPLLFLLGAVLGTLLPALCLVGVGRLAVLSKKAPASRTHSTYAASTPASHSPRPSAVSTAVVPQPSTVTPAISASSATKVPFQLTRINRKSPRAATSARLQSASAGN